MKRKVLVVLIAGLVGATALPPRPAVADTSVVKLAMLMPEGSVWHQAFKDMEADWAQASQGRVTVRLYPGGVAGDDPDMVRKMRIGQLQAAALTINGLSDIDPAFKVFRMPMFFASYEELEKVVEKLTPLLTQRLDAKGFVLLSWGEAGWVNLFTSKPCATIDDLKGLKLFSWAGDDSMVQWWKANGFQPVSLSSTDIPTALQTGMVQALPTTPLAALALQWYRQANHMLQLGMGPLLGATVITKKAWEGIPVGDRAKLVEAAVKVQKRLAAEVPQQDAQALEEMKKRGLEVTPVQGEREAQWRAAAAKLAETMRGSIVPPDIYDLALRERDAYRKQKAAGGKT